MAISSGISAGGTGRYIGVTGLGGKVGGTSSKSTASSASSLKSSSGGSKKSGAATSSAGALDLYGQYLDEQRALEAALAAQKQALAQDAYNQNMAALAAAYNQRTALLRGNLDSTLSQLQSGYDYSEGVVNQNTLRDLQSAYVNMMMNKRDMPQLLAAQGISGGLSESTLAGIRGNYGGERNDLNLRRAASINELLNTLANNQNSARQQYNTQLSEDSLARANAEIQLKNALANGIAQILSAQYSNIAKIDQSYLSKMASLVK